MPNPDWRLYAVLPHAAGWEAVKALRHEVFVVEQQVSPEEEFDAFEGTSWHVMVTTCRHEQAINQHPALATGRWRITPEGNPKIERCAVSQATRGQGAGATIVKALLNAIHLTEPGRYPNTYLHAQDHAIPFYEKLGFEARGPVFEEAGILHRKMHVISPAPLLTTS